MTYFWWNQLREIRSYSIHPVFRVIACCDLDLWLLTQKLISSSMDPNTSATQNWAKVPLLVFEMWCLRGFRDSQADSRIHVTHSLTDGQTRMQYASGTVFQRRRRHNNITFHWTMWTVIYTGFKGINGQMWTSMTWTIVQTLFPRCGVDYAASASHRQSAPLSLLILIIVSLLLSLPVSSFVLLFLPLSVCFCVRLLSCHASSVNDVNVCRVGKFMFIHIHVVSSAHSS